MSRLERSRGLRLICTLAAIFALIVILFPVYAIIVGSFESTNTLFSGTFYWLPHAPTLDNYRTVLGGANAATQETVSGSQTGAVLTSLLVGLGTALLALVVAVPAAYALSKYRMRVTVIFVSALLVAQIVPSIVLATSLFIVFHSEAPSTLAASISSLGRLKKNARSTRIANGTAYVPSARMSPKYEFTRWTQWKTMKSEVARTIDGTI